MPSKANEFGGHTRHAENAFPAPAVKLFSHAIHATEPINGAMLFSAHDRHGEDPIESLYVPRGHAKHTCPGPGL